jgi:hypothetical protein
MRRARPGGRYQVAGRERCVPENLLFPRPAYFTCEQVLTELARLLEMVGRRFDEAGICWWATQGTLVGALRHQGVIPWDHDVDLNLMLEQLPLLLELEGEFERLGLRLKKAAGGYKLGYARWPLFPYLDLVPMAQRDAVWQLAFPLDQKGRPTFRKHLQWPQEAIRDQDLFPLQRWPFEGFEVWVPARAREFARQMYGPECLSSIHCPRFPWLINHYWDSVLFALRLTRG